MNHHFNQDFNLMKKAHDFSQMETLTKQRHHLTLKMETLRYHLTMKMETLVKKRDHLSMKALTKQRNHLRKMVSFHFIPILLMHHVRRDFHFTQKILHLQLYAFWTLVAQEPWDLGKQLMHFADTWAHIQTVVFGMRFILQAQDSSLQTLNNQNVLRRLSSSCTIMDGIPNSQSSTLSKKVMSHC